MLSATSQNSELKLLGGQGTRMYGSGRDRCLIITAIGFRLRRGLPDPIPDKGAYEEMSNFWFRRPDTCSTISRAGASRW